MMTFTLGPNSGGPNDEFFMNITSLSNEVYEGGPRISEQIIVYASEKDYLNQIPQPMNPSAESAEILETILAEGNTSRGGIDDWTINITLVKAEGYAGGPVDNGNSWRLIVVCVYYYPMIIPIL